MNVKSREEENITSRQRQGMSLERGRIRGISNSNVSYAPAISRVINTALLLLLTLSSMAETVKPQRLFEKKEGFKIIFCFIILHSVVALEHVVRINVKTWIRMDKLPAEVEF